MPSARQRVMSEERMVRQRQPGEGTLITMEEIGRCLAVYESLHRAEGTIKFYLRKLTEFYEDLAEDNRVGDVDVECWRDSLM